MQEQINLFPVEESYNLANLKQICFEFVKKKYTRSECEPYDEFIDFLNDECELELVSRLRQIADQIEKKVLGK